MRLSVETILGERTKSQRDAKQLHTKGGLGGGAWREGVEGKRETERQMERQRFF